MRLGLILLLLLLVSCAETPSKPTTSGGSSSGSGKVVTATPEEPYECDSDLILEPHLPEECIPPEPPEPVVQKPVEPPKPDPIVGTYKVFTTDPANIKRLQVWRIYPDHTVRPLWGRTHMTWERDADEYRFQSPTGRLYFSVERQSVMGEPDFTATAKYNADDTLRYAKGIYDEGVKLASDPDFQFDLFRVGEISYRSGTWGCVNIGRNEQIHRGLYKESRDTPDQYAETLEECEALCPEVLAQMKRQFPKLNDEQHTCPQDRR